MERTINPMANGDQSDLIDLVYDSALQPSLWTEVMEKLADLVGGSSGWLSQLDFRDGRGAHSSDAVSRIDPVWTRRYLDHFAGCNPIAREIDPEEFLRSWAPRILTHDDKIERATLVRTEFYNDFLRPQNIESTMMIRLARHGVETAVINLNCPTGRDRFSADDIDAIARYHPHLIRAYNLGRKLAAGASLDRAAGALFEQSANGLFLVDHNGRVLRANSAAERILDRNLDVKVTAGRLTLADHEPGRRLRALICAASPLAQPRRGGAMPLATAGGRMPLAITVTPVSEARSWAYRVGPSALVCLTELDAPVDLPHERLRSLFDLTQKESRLALALLEGLTPHQAAERFGVSPHTVHVQLAHVFQKTGATRQADLVRMLMRLAPAECGGIALRQEP